MLRNRNACLGSIIATSQRQLTGIVVQSHVRLDRQMKGDDRKETRRGVLGDRGPSRGAGRVSAELRASVLDRKPLSADPRPDVERGIPADAPQNIVHDILRVLSSIRCCCLRERGFYVLISSLQAVLDLVPIALKRSQIYVNFGKRYLRNARNRFATVVFLLPDSLPAEKGFRSARWPEGSRGYTDQHRD